jgi:hypothetical protein
MDTMAVFGDLPTPKITVSGHGQGLSDDLQRLGRLARPRVAPGWFQGWSLLAVDGKVMVDPHPPWQFLVGQVLRNLQVMTPRVFINKRFTSASCYLLKIKAQLRIRFSSLVLILNQHHLGVLARDNEKPIGRGTSGSRCRWASASFSQPLPSAPSFRRCLGAESEPWLPHMFSATCRFP